MQLRQVVGLLTNSATFCFCVRPAFYNIDRNLRDHPEIGVAKLTLPLLWYRLHPDSLSTKAASMEAHELRVLDKAGKLHGSHFVSGGDGRGGQAAPAARFALAPGTYRVEVRYSNGDGHYKIQEIRLGGTHTKLVVNN